MPSRHERFWHHSNYAVVGRSSVKPFPRLTYKALKEAEGKTVYAVDSSCEEIDGDPAYDDLADLPDPIEAVVLEVPKEETASWVERAADTGVTRVWIHMGRETPEALELAEERGIEVCAGTCAVQYLTGGFPHNIHRFLRKAAGRW